MRQLVRYNVFFIWYTLVYVTVLIVHILIGILSVIWYFNVSRFKKIDNTLCRHYIRTDRKEFTYDTLIFYYAHPLDMLIGNVRTVHYFNLFANGSVLSIPHNLGSLLVYLPLAIIWLPIAILNVLKNRFTKKDEKAG